MVYDEGLAYRITKLLSDRFDIVEKKMFGGLVYLHNGNMMCGIVKDELMVRIGNDKYQVYLKEEFAREMDFTGRSLKGMLYVSTDGFEEDDDLHKWVDRALAFTSTLPAK